MFPRKKYLFSLNKLYSAYEVLQVSNGLVLFFPQEKGGFVLEISVIYKF